MRRRDFFKWSVGGAGLAAAGWADGSLTDSSLSGDTFENQGHPWWVKIVEKPKTAVDDRVYSRFDASKNVFGSMARYYGPDRLKTLRLESAEKTKQFYQKNEPGFRLEDRALADAAWVISRLGGLNRGTRSWTESSMRTPQERGIDPFQATPGEAARLVKAAARFFGAATVGITELDRRHINATERGKTIAFEPMDRPREEGDELVIPDKCRYAIALTVQMSLDNIACSPTAISSAGSALGYSRCEFLVAGLAEFIRGLGYVAIPSVNDLGSSVAIALDAGLGELGRTNRLITPQFGPMVRLAKVVTDLPLETDRPIDFGLMEFCRVCKRCAENCPAGCVSTADDPDFKVKGEWNNPGHMGWFEDAPRCFAFWSESTSGCSNCLAACPWSKKDKTIIHEIVKASSAKIPALDGFFTYMDEAFGYGEQKSAKKWWSLDLPEYGIDTTRAKG